VAEEHKRRRSGIHYSWIILLIGVITVMGALGFARFGYTMILPSMKEGLGINDVQAGDLATGNMIGYLLLSLTGGLLASRYGPRIIISIFMVIIALSMLLTGLAPNFQVALFGRVLTGIGSGGANVPIMGLVSAWFATRRRGLASGIIVSGSSLGLIVTGFLIPALLTRHSGEGWRYSWIYLAGFTLLIALLGYVLLRNRPTDMGLLPIGTTDKDPVKDGSRVSALQWNLIYKSSRVWYLSVIYVLFGLSYVIYATFFARHLIGEGILTTQAAGTLWSLIGVVSILSGFLWGSVSDWIGRKYSLAMVFALQGTSFLLFGLWNTLPGIYVSALLFALTAWSIPAIVAATAGDLLGARLAPAAFGFITLFFGFGQAAGPFLAGRIAQVTGSYTNAFILAGVAALCGMLTALFIRNPKTAL